MRAGFILFLLLSTNRMFGQELLANGGFEDENTCTEFKVECAPEAWIGTVRPLKNYINSTERSHSGEYCYAIEAGHFKKAFERSLIRSRLLCGLRAGNKYRLELFVKSIHPILDSIGVYFTKEDIFYEKKKFQDITPTFYLNQQNQFNNKDTTWQKAVIEFVSTGRENFITLGNFSRRDITGPTGLRLLNEYLVFIDDISLTPLNPNEQLCDDWKLKKQEIYDQNERHQYMERLIKLERYNKLTDTTALTLTRLITIDTLILSDILFETGKSKLQSAAYKVLDSLCARSKGRKIDSIMVKGHTDNKGQFQSNEKLSIDRAKAVANYLQQCGLRRVSAEGLADRFPVADNQNPQGRQRNRRVEILLFIRD